MKTTDRNPSQSSITLSARCGSARHEIVYSVTPWGHAFQAYSPCQSLPGRLIRALGGHCESLVCQLRLALQWTAIPCTDFSAWFEESLDPRRELQSYLTQLANNQTQIAGQILGTTSEERLLSALRLGTTSEKWAASVIANHSEIVSDRLLSLLRSNCTSTQPVTRALALACVVRSSTKPSRCCVGEYLLDESVALPMRDYLAFKLAGVPTDIPVSQLSCELTESNGCKRTESWEELRRCLRSIHGDKVTKICRKF